MLANVLVGVVKWVSVSVVVIMASLVGMMVPGAVVSMLLSVLLVG